MLVLVLEDLIIDIVEVDLGKNVLVDVICVVCLCVMLFYVFE